MLQPKVRILSVVQFLGAWKDAITFMGNLDFGGRNTEECTMDKSS